MHYNRETVIIPQNIIVPTKSIIIASLVRIHSDELEKQHKSLDGEWNWVKSEHLLASG